MGKGMESQSKARRSQRGATSEDNPPLTFNVAMELLFAVKVVEAFEHLSQDHGNGCFIKRASLHLRTMSGGRRKEENK